MIVVAGLAVLLAAALGGYAAVRARAQGSGAGQVLAPVAQPTPAPSGSAAADPEPQYQRWTVGKAVGPVTVYARPSTSAPVKTRLGKVNQNGYPTLVLVDATKETGGRVWYRVWLAMRPNGSRGWVPEGKLAFYTTSSKITIDLSERTLSVYRRGALIDTYPVAVGKPGLEHADRLLLREPEAQAAGAGRRLRRARDRASARSSPSCRTGRRAVRWRSTAPTRTS